MDKETKVVHTAVIRAIPWYTCRKCGMQMSGSTLRMEFINVHGTSLDELVARHQIPRSHIPYGWCSDGTDGVQCSNCKPKEVR